ncbi:MAG: NADH-quinone oxidoreductase subunit M [Verrucomicrobia bacterium]|nr:NADH-quinone oxidoreductase subunit M [Verrucomicrobiota bacterium]
MQSLSFIILCPLLAAGLIALVPRNYQVVFRSLALLSTLLSLLGAIRIFAGFDTGSAALQFEEQVAWVDSLGISYHVAVDGINVGLILMGAVVAFAAVCVSREITARQKEYYLLLLLMAGGILGAFASYDLFFFYFFHELALVPTFILIGVWGRGEQRNYATFKITLYLSLGALVALVGLIALYLEAGHQTFNLWSLARQLEADPIDPARQRYLFPLLLFGFGILVSLWPFHTWAPLGYAAAPTAVAMLHAGVLKKFGLYGLIRVAVPLLPAGVQSWAEVLAWLCLGNILYCSLVAMRQKDLNLLLGNSSVAHVGFAFLGIASLTLLGLTGAVVVMVAHGFLAALTFALSGYVRQQTGTVNLDHMGGLLERLPFIGGVLVMAFLAGCGLPGFANFPGEALVLFGAWQGYPGVAILAAWGALILAAVYMLRAVRVLLHGPLPERWGKVADAPHLWHKLPYGLLLAALLLFGCWPRLLTDKIQPCVADIVRRAEAPPANSAAGLARIALPPAAAPALARPGATDGLTASRHPR